MSFKLVIAEKPSVAQSIAKVIGASERGEGYLIGNGYIVSWCVGHLVELASPEVYDEKFEKWRYADLPILPTDWKYQVSDSTKKQFQILKGLMERSDVTSLCNACDAGREGELIFRLVYMQARCKKPFERLWISSMEDQAISDGFSNLRAGAEYDELYEAALCRERADWIVGMNATRLFSTLYGQTLNVGRVMTPTLAMIVEREAQIEGFKPEPFYRVAITCGGVKAYSERFSDKKEAEALLQKIQANKSALLSKLEETEKKEKAPQLYSLTALQRDANRFLGFTAQQTLDYTQSLYEKKLVTYPRTDSRFLTEDMADGLPNLVQKMRDKYGFTRPIPVNVSQVINNKKVTDHHAIIPTLNVAEQVYSELPSGEQKVLGLVVARLLAAVGDAATKAETSVEFTSADTVFKTKATVLKIKGWHEIQDWIVGSKSEDADSENDEKDQSENPDIIDYVSYLEQGRTYPVQNPEMEEGKTSPKKRFTEDSLLSAMERAGADEMSDEVERKGIGTSATRAGTIEKLVRIGFVERKGDKKTKYLIPTHKGIALITVMPEQIQSVSMTADWEQKLLDIEKAKQSSDDFMDEIEVMVKNLVSNYKVIEDAEVLMHPALESIGNCPCCGSHVIEKQKGFFCENKECKFVLWKQNRFFDAIGKKMTKAVAENLLQKGQVRLSNCVSKKTGNSYSAILHMKVDEQQRPVFEMEFDSKQSKGGSYGKGKDKENQKVG